MAVIKSKSGSHQLKVVCHRPKSSSHPPRKMQVIDLKKCMSPTKIICQSSNQKMSVINQKPCVSDLKMQVFAQKIVNIDQEKFKLSTTKNASYQ